MGGSYKIVSLNVAGLTNVIKRKRIAKYLKTERASLICLQKTHLKEQEVGVRYIMQQRVADHEGL